MILEISSHGSVLKRQNDLFIVKNEDGKSEVPAEKVDAIITSANILISSQAIKLCIEKNIQLVVTDWAGRPVARLWVSTAGKSTELRRRQYANQDTVLGVQISIELVRTKLKRQKEFLQDLKNNRKVDVPEITRAIDIISDALLQIRKLQPDNRVKQSLLGLEGTSASAYFRAISSSLPSKWSFEHRSQYPALDGFNALLNYAYGIAYSDVEKIIILSGLDPNSGFYHADSYGKPTLSFDLMELVRPLIDRTVVSLFNKKMVSERWFEKNDDSSIFLKKDARLTLLTSYSEKNRKELEKITWRFCREIIERLTSGDKEA
ncbi:CRISPR-associated endonuclease Cas1 [Candidatus Nitrososphaera evergladensis SR1]|uniref:CRISPR-associated endonuclease Cas1 n=1 Tax=Candidatus Nitrososphaera evergladensis SR1 TaxID=1459636 RepID=A0A075MTU9_9ARCH|nr:CRISPR-associated endonuclease Cas1 [Candidatus Nitrososphaera evergladensis]AIF84615.1 CRISPR-associated endonuclease Cas1 [Candidatus Nitrososphaera evergladensis SR1]